MSAIPAVLRSLLALMLCLGLVAGEAPAPGVVGDPEAPVTGVAGGADGVAAPAPTAVDPPGPVAPVTPTP
jgi:hypothetical protein